MGKSSRTGRRNGTVTVIETRVHRNSARNARLAFVLAAIVHRRHRDRRRVAVDPAGPVAADRHRHRRHRRRHLLDRGPCLAGGPRCLVVARRTPRLRDHHRRVVAAGHPYPARRPSNRCCRPSSRRLLIPTVRRPIVALGWCFVVRHRLRTCFAQFIVANQSGSLPLILAARPTPVGERVWIYLRPGLSVNELQSPGGQDRRRLSRLDRHHRPGQQPHRCVRAGRHQTPRRPRRPRRHTPRHHPFAFAGVPGGHPAGPPRRIGPRRRTRRRHASRRRSRRRRPGPTPPTPLAEPLTATIVPIRPPMPPTSSKKVAATVVGG